MGSRLAHRYLTGGAGYPWALLRGGPAAAEAAATPGPVATLAGWFWIGVIGFGLLLPLALSVVELVAEPAGARATASVAVAKFALVLVGGFLLRVVIVWGGDVKAPLPFPPQLWQVPGVLPPGLGG